MSDDTTVRVMILFLLDHFGGSLSFRALNDIVLWDQQVNYFVFLDGLRCLTERGAISEEGDGEDCLYTLTDNGKRVLSTASDTLTAPMRQQLLHAATRLLSRDRSELMPSATVTPEQEGFLLRCELRDLQHLLFAQEFYLDSLPEAEALKKRFLEHAHRIYASSLSLLSGDVRLMI